MSELTQALLEVQKEAPKLQKDGNNPHFGNDYVTLPALLDTVVPLLNERGVLLTQFPASSPEEKPMLVTRFEHVESGEFIETAAPLILERDNSQGMGSAITYMRRYAIMSALALVAGEDEDDGEAASKGRAKSKSKSSSGQSGQKKPDAAF